MPRCDRVTTVLTTPHTKTLLHFMLLAVRTLASILAGMWRLCRTVESAVLAVAAFWSAAR